MEAIEHRHTTERGYQSALMAWQRATANPEMHPQWSQFYANALRDALSKANNRRHEVLAKLTMADWRALVYRELQTEQWYVEAQSDCAPNRLEDIQTFVPLAVGTRRNGNGVHRDPDAV